MLKNTKKVIALLVAASSTISLVPLKAYASERLETKEGSIDEAVSFKDGKYLYKGYLTDEDNDSIYFNDGASEIELDKLRDADIEFKYGSKCVFMKDSDDEYFVDLSNGNVEEDEELETKIDSLQSKLKTALKRTDRYGKNVDLYLSKETMIRSNNFSNVLYLYAARIDEDADGYEDSLRNNYVDVYGNNSDYMRNDRSGYLFGFTDDSANYIDVSHNANMYVYSSKREKMVKVEKYNDTNNDAEVVVSPVFPPIAIAQDEDYIYALVHVIVFDKNNNDNNLHVYIQKISKHQGEKVDEAYIPESVESYEISKGFDCEDAKDAQKDWIDSLDLIVNSIDDIDDILGNLPVKFIAKNGSIYTIRLNDESEMKVSKYDFKKEKVKADGEDGYLTTDYNLDVKLLEKDDEEDQDIASGWDSISIDVDGNIWALDKGKIVKFDELNAKEMYTCDRSLNNLEVYDGKNLIAWDGTDDGDVFSVVQDGQSDKNEIKEEIKDDNKSGWVKNSNGTWSYYQEGIAVKGKWIQDGNWYYINEDGIMATGWLLNNGNWYYLSKQLGAMQTGWLEDIDGKWYYLNPTSGAMMTDTSIDGYSLGSDGAWIR